MRITFHLFTFVTFLKFMIAKFFSFASPLTIFSALFPPSFFFLCVCICVYMCLFGSVYYTALRNAVFIKS